MAFGAGVNFNASEKGLLTVDEERLQTIINPKPISEVYNVEQTPFAR